MNRKAILGFIGVFAAASAAHAQQAAIPTPPKTVHPLPQSTTDCRGCSDANADKTKSSGSYDQVVTDSAKRRTATSPTAATAKPKAKAKAHRRHTTKAKRKPRTAVKTTVTPVTAKPVYRDKPAVLDPMMRPTRDSIRT